jgi:hypothetical protein
MLKNKTFAIVVHACDRYKILFRGFEYFFNKYWQRNENIKCYFFTEEFSYESPTFKNIKTNVGEWADRLKRGLDQIPEKYVIYLQEDMWLTKFVDQDTIMQVLEFVQDNNIKNFKLHSSNVYKTTPTSFYINRLNIATIDKEGSDFLMSHQISVWDKEFLIKQLVSNEHPWRNERKGTKRMRKLSEPFYHLDLFAENGNAPINQNLDLLKRSEYMAISNNAMLNDRVFTFLKDLKDTKDEELQTYAGKLEFNFKNKITHDGNPPARKTDIIKRIKNYFLSLKK